MLPFSLNVLCIFTGTFGLVDYTNSEDMKYAVSVLKCSGSIWILGLFSSSSYTAFTCIVLILLMMAFFRSGNWMTLNSKTLGQNLIFG